jgi:serine/threonine protein kinase
MGYTPYEFDGEDIESLLESIYGGYLNFEESLPKECRHFVFNLLQTNPKKRMSLEQAREHNFFRNIQEERLSGLGCKCEEN